MATEEGNGLVFALSRTARGRWREIGWPEIEAWRHGPGLTWVHLDRVGERARRYLREDSGLDPVVADALLADETRPREFWSDDALFIVLRGVNLNPGAEPDDMVSLRTWIEKDRIITCRHRRLMVIQDMREQVAAGAGPSTPGDFLVELAHELIDRLAPIMHSLEDRIDGLEDDAIDGDDRKVRALLGEVRRQVIQLRRHLAPQREVMARLLDAEVGWLSRSHKVRLREAADRLTRYVEELNAMRERTLIIQDEVGNWIAEQMSRNTYLLSIVATLVLPIGVITGLLGVNVDGMPATKDAPWAFGAVTAGLLVLVAIQLVVLRWRKLV